MSWRRRSRWTADLLKEHYDSILADRTAVEQRTAATMDKRLNDHNNLLERFVTKDELARARTELRATVAVAAAVATAASAWVHFK